MNDSAVQKVVLVDDEEPSRRKLRGLIEARPDLELVAECATAVEALRALRMHAPDLVFLDIRLPDLDGFEVLELASTSAVDAAIVFVTAFNDFACRAFEVGAVDYLLKPVDAVSFNRAVERARGRLAARRESGEPASQTSPDTTVDSEGQLRRFLARDGGRIVVVPAEQVLWFEAEGNYVMLHCADRVHRVRVTMAQLEKQLEPKRFFRVHRSTIVNLEHVRDLTHVLHGDYIVRMSDGAEVALTSSRRDEFTRALGGYGSRKRSA